MTRDYKSLFKNLNDDFAKDYSAYETVKKTPKNSSVGSSFFNRSSSFYGLDAKARKESVEANEQINKHIKAKKTESYVFRAFSNNDQKMLINDYRFGATNNNAVTKKKSELFRKYFMMILFKSGYTFESFMDELIKNVMHGNVFIKKTYKKEFLAKLTIMPVIGWSASKQNGFEIEEFEFSPNSKDSYIFNSFVSVSKKTFKKSDIIHLKFNYETGELFGTPFLSTAIEDISLLRDIETADANNYIDSAQSKPFVRVGDTQHPGSPQEIEDIDDYFQNTKEDEIPVFNGKAQLGVLTTPRVPGSDVIDNFKNRMFAATGVSKSSMGSDKLGRQTADVDSENEDTTVSSLQMKMCSQLNEKLFLEINQILFPDCYDLDEFIKIIPNEPFNITERKEKHNLLMWQGGGLDQKEYERRLGFSIQTEKCYSKVFESTPGNSGSVSQLSSPSNQYGKKTSSKPSKKD